MKQEKTKEAGREIGRAIEQHLKTMEVLKESTDDYLFLWNYRTGWVHFAGSIYEKYKLPGEAKKYRSRDIERMIYARDIAAVEQHVRLIEEGKSDICNIEFRLLNRNEDRVWVSCRGKVLRGENGGLEALIGTVSDTVMVKKADPLTGLLNMDCFLQDMEECLRQSEKGYLLVLGIDDFKNINIQHGRGYGNYILKTVAEIMEETVDVSLSIYRLEGDRFAVNLKDRTEGMVHSAYLLFQERLAPYCTMSAGAVAYGEEIIENSSVLYQYAENALDRAKKRGKNNLLFFSAEDYEKSLNMIELQDELKNSVRNGFAGFSLCYQAQISGADYGLFGAEALLRYKSPSRGPVRPDEFIPILEQTEMIIPVGEWVLEMALRQCKYWRKWIPDFHISVNVSYVQLRQKDITEKVLELLRKAGVAGRNLTLEVTESIHLQDYQYFNRIFYRWRKCGIQIAIDDFGTGYSSLGYLKSMEINEIKIDRCFVNRIQHSAYNYRLISNIIELAHSTQVRVCCEGVETEEELFVLKEMQPELLQGYLFARPYEPEEFEQYFVYQDSERYQRQTEQRENFCKLYCERTGEKIQEEDGGSDLDKIVENMDEIIYVSDTDSYELYYLNPAGRILTGIHDYKGQKCYKVLQGLNEPCPFCTNQKLNAESFYVWERDNTYYGRCFLLKDKLIPWNGKTARMEIAIDVSEKEHVSQKIQERLDFEQNIVACTRALIEEPDVEDAVIEVLHRIGEFYQADRAYIFEVEPGGAFWKNTYEWCEDGVTSQQDGLQEVPAQGLQRWRDVFDRGEFITILNVEHIKDEHPIEWEILKGQGIRRLLAVPIKKNQSNIGFVGVDNPRSHHRDAEQLHTMSCFLAEYIHNEESGQGLEDTSGLRREEVLRMTNLGLWKMTIEAETGASEMYGDQNMKRILGIHKKVNPQEMYEYWHEHINGEYYDYVERSIEKLLASRRLMQMEYIWEHPDKGEIMVQCLGIRDDDINGKICLKGYHRMVNEIERLQFLESEEVSVIFEYDEEEKSVHFYSGRELLAECKKGEEDFPECWITHGVIHPKYADQFRRLFSHVEKQKDFREQEVLLKARDGKYQWFRLEPHHLNMVREDEKTMVVRLEKSATRWSIGKKYLWKSAFYEAMLSQTAAFAEVDLGSGELKNVGGLWSEYAEECRRKKKGFPAVLDEHIAEHVHPRDVELFRKFVWEELYSDRCLNGVWTKDFSFRRNNNGSYVWMKMIGHVFRDEYTDSVYALLYLKDIDLEKRKEMLLERAANLDPLTGVCNRAVFEREVCKYMEEKRENGKGALVLLDLDDFKGINDLYGHVKGDEALKALTKVLKMTFRRGDLIGRLGGDEFLVFIKNIEEKDSLNRRMEELFSVLYCLPDLPLRCSVGISLVEGKDFSYSRSLEQADKALYESKRHGKDRYSYYDDIKEGKDGI